MALTTRKRFFIIGTGRTGSSLLSAILQDSGANFGMSSVNDWASKYGGAYEHPDIIEAYKWFSRVDKIKESFIPNTLTLKYCWKRTNDTLTKLLNEVEFIKHPDVMWMLHSIYHLDFEPVVIISYRDLEGFARSRYLRYGWDFPRIVSAYIQYYSTALLQLQVFGGCTVDYAELNNPDETQWAQSLATVTGLSADTILRKREERLKPIHHDSPDLSALSKVNDLDKIQALYAALRQTRGQVFSTI